MTPARLGCATPSGQAEATGKNRNGGMARLYIVPMLTAPEGTQTPSPIWIYPAFTAYALTLRQGLPPLGRPPRHKGRSALVEP